MFDKGGCLVRQPFFCMFTASLSNYMLQSLTIIYRIIIVLLLVFSLVAKFMVGVAGHNSGFDIGEVIFFGFIITSFISLMLFQNLREGHSKNIFRYLSAGLVLIGGTALLWAIYQGFTEGDPTYWIIFIIMLLSLLSGLLFWKLIRYKND